MKLFETDYLSSVKNLIDKYSEEVFFSPTNRSAAISLLSHNFKYVPESAELEEEIKVLSNFTNYDKGIILRTYNSAYQDNFRINRLHEIVKYNSDEPDREKINFSVIEDFQGLEASFVILIGVKDLNDSFLRSQYYIALTRSTYSAGILFHKDLFSDLNNIINMDS